MNTMKCYNCLYKHLAGALSYCKEILDGHDDTNELDHRIDLLGQLVNAEHHAELIDESITSQIKALRSNLQNRRIEVDQAVIQTIRTIYKRIQDIENVVEQPKIKIPVEQRKKLFSDIKRDDEKYSIVIDNVDDKDKFELCYKLIKSHCLNEHEIFVLNPKIEVKDVAILNGRLYDNLYKLTDNFIYMKQSYLLLKPFDFNNMQAVYTQHEASNMNKLRLNRFCYSYDSGCPQVLNKGIYKDVMGQDDEKDILSSYFNYHQQKQPKNAHFVVVQLHNKLCCSNKAQIGMVNFATYYNNTAYQSVKEWINQNLTI